MEACPQPLGYRSRARVQIRKSGRTVTTGFFRPQSHAIEPIEQCPLLRPQLNQALLALRDFGANAALDEDVGELDIAASEESGVWTAVSPKGILFEGEGPVLLRRGAGQKETLLERRIGAFTYAVSPSAFFQANDFMTGRLVDLVLEMSQGGSARAALDLYSGVGLFSLPLAAKYDSVIAVENSGVASDLCAANISAAGAKGIRPVRADVSDWLESHPPAKDSPFDLVLLDPPRTGAGIETMRHVQALAPETVLYVSCDPQTLARDLSCLAEGRYAIDLISGLDMFPQTFHFETVVRLKRGNV
jgi:23S rRNA (uracil1939-C5)-methyltransferase